MSNNEQVTEKKPICSCKFPIIVRDIRDGISGRIDFYGIPLDVIGDVGLEPPDMRIVKKIMNGVEREYMKVTWLEPPTNAAEHEVLGHIMVAGCEEGALTCDVKSIFVVYHPIEEWLAKHIIEIR